MVMVVVVVIVIVMMVVVIVMMMVMMVMVVVVMVVRELHRRREDAARVCLGRGCLGDCVRNRIEQFCIRLRRRKRSGPGECARGSRAVRKRQCRGGADQPDDRLVQWTLPFGCIVGE